MFLAQRHKAVMPVRLKSATLKHSTTEPLCSLQCRRCRFSAKQKILPNLLDFSFKCFAHSSLEKEYPHFMFLTTYNKVIESLKWSFLSWVIKQLFHTFLRNSPHHGRYKRKQTVENKESNVMFGIIK